MRCSSFCLPAIAAPPSPVTSTTEEAPSSRTIPRKVVYLPSCVTRMMGPAASDYETASVHEKLMSLFAKVKHVIAVVCKAFLCL